MTDTESPGEQQLVWHEYAVAFWPLIMFVFGGALGGALGGGAGALNLKILKSDMSAPMRYGATVLVGLSAIALYFLSVVVLVLVFPDLFAAEN